MTTSIDTNEYAAAVADALCVTKCLHHRIAALRATQQIAEIAQRIGLLEGHLQCRDFTAQEWAKENIEIELTEKKALLQTIYDSL